MTEFPQYDDNGEERLFFPNIWRNIEPQEILGADCFLPFATVNNGMNRFVMDITGADFTKMLSALYLGVEIAYPDTFMQVLVNFLKMVHCPIDFEEECQEYPPYTPFMQYTPESPFIDPNEVPEGYLVPPFVVVDASNAGEFPQNEIGDVVVVPDAITLDIDWFETIAGQLPTIQIHVEGQGNANLKFLNQVQGGLVVVTVDNPPDLADIIIGIVTASENIIDLNMDILSLPPETAVEHVYPVEVLGAGSHTIYCVFLPILDDSLIPLRFGGGFRSIELCDFGEIELGYVQDVRWNDDEYMLEQQKNGVYEPVTDFDIFLGYFDQVALDAQNGLATAQTAQNYITNDIVPALADHEERIEALEASQATQDTDIAALQANAISQGTSIENLSTDLEALEDEVAALALSFADQAIWSHEFDFTASEGIWSGGADYVAGQGYLFDANENINSSGISVRDSRITYIELFVKRVSGSNIAVEAQYTPTFNSQNVYVPTGAGSTAVNWMQINPIPGSHSPQIKMIPAASNSFYLQKMVFWGRGADPF